MRPRLRRTSTRTSSTRSRVPSGAGALEFRPAAQLAVNLEPLYAIVLAALLFGEQRELGAAFYAGAAILLASVLIHPWLAQRARQG